MSHLSKFLRGGGSFPQNWKIQGGGGFKVTFRQQGFETNQLQNSFNKFVNRHGLIADKYGAALQVMRLAIQA